MLYLLAIVYVIIRISVLVSASRRLDKTVVSKIIFYLVIEIVLVFIGIFGVVVLFSGGGGNKTLMYARLIVGVVALIASGRVGMHIRKLEKGNISIPGDVKGNNYALARNSLISEILLLIVAGIISPLYPYLATILYLIGVILAIFSISKITKASRLSEVSKLHFLLVLIINIILAIVMFMASLGPFVLEK